MKLLITLVFSIFFLKNYSQTSDIGSVHFHHHNSSLIYSEIDIFFYYQDDNSIKVYVKTHTKDNEYIITPDKFQQLSAPLLRINPKDIIQDVGNCWDPSETEINFGSRNMPPGTGVTYSVTCLSSKDSDTVWKDYLTAVNLILEIAKLKFSDLK